ncbi:MAG: hypothetical protein EOS11_14555 [Mesorhizobium sp.]|nr:MAG: hypothetical protein EOS11_14555 [Mesorhizobium sp.]
MVDLRWEFDVEDSSQSNVDEKQITSTYAPYRISARKPAPPTDVIQMVCRVGLAQLFRLPPRGSRVWAATLAQPFETISVRISPWGDNAVFRPQRLQADPRRVVRETGSSRLVEADLSRWLLRRDSPLPWDDRTFQTWARLSATALLRSLASEIVEGVLVFRGPPTKRLEEDSPDPLRNLERDGFALLQDCCLWVVENDREHEGRHGLFATEFARSVATGSSIGTNFRKDGRDALEGAKIAYQFGLSEISRDALRAMSDLRKAVSDEAAKLTESTRQLAMAVAGAMFGGIGLVIARLAVPTPGNALSVAIFLIGIVLVLYVVAIIYTGVQFMGLQKRLREQWRSRLYRFLPENDYQAMVQKPADDAEDGFKQAAWFSGLLAFILLVAFLIVAFVL